MEKFRWADLIKEALLYGFLSFGAIYVAKQIVARLDPEASAKQEAQQKALAATARLSSFFQEQQDQDETEEGDAEEKSGYQTSRRRPEPEDLRLNQYEQAIAMEVVAPSEIPVTFNDIGGLDHIVEELRESVIYPLTYPQLYTASSSLLSAPSGVLLYGPPGCGKTMLAKALARESGACFINLHISTLTEKWYGDSNKLVSAVFSLARKLQPSIVFIDEIDAVLGQRRSGEHEASGMVKAEFMTHWDGLTSANSAGQSQRICILGATNRIQDIDEAILRRLPKKFPISLPTAAQRRSIFKLTLRDTKLDKDPNNFDLDLLVKLSAGMSGSDIKESCRDAAMVPVREFFREAKARGGSMKSVKPDSMRGLQTDDFFGRRANAARAKAMEEVDDEWEDRDSPRTLSDTDEQEALRYQEAAEVKS
ncbi:P-loop containing nucleoside triphosphate hydrolase protein [Elsinoe ampelina]|uniref:P-loop containing nucleoside triphosphate hydrolase protein n=1 Tax=Elsinoe ampelina TaxID=302913 RepID=A0A6A6GM32_9PEZI|nr:P-loop containing nucleoside triphosphate hydrolase protein [Elsinoe ampelina]